MFQKRSVFVLMVIAALALTVAGQKTKATPTPAPRATDNDKSMDEEAAQFKKTLNSLVKMLDSGFKDIRGEEMTKVRSNRRFKPSVTLLQAELCEIVVPSWAKLDSDQARYVAYYPKVPAQARRKMYDRLIEAVTAALGPDFQGVRLSDDDPDSDSFDETYEFMRKGSIKTVVTISYCGAPLPIYDTVKTDVILIVGYSLL